MVAQKAAAGKRLGTQDFGTNVGTADLLRINWDRLEELRTNCGAVDHMGQ